MMTKWIKKKIGIGGVCSIYFFPRRDGNVFIFSGRDGNVALSGLRLSQVSKYSGDRCFVQYKLAKLFCVSYNILCTCTILLLPS